VNTRNAVKDRKKRSVSKTRTSELKNYSPEGTRIEVPPEKSAQKSPARKIKKALEKKTKQKIEEKMQTPQKSDKKLNVPQESVKTSLPTVASGQVT
jgi:hypothetical protein